MRRKTTFANIHVKNMTHVTELELNTRAFAPPFLHIPFIPVGRTKECQECAHILLQVGSSTVRFKNVPLTNESKISLRSRSCSPAIIAPIVKSLPSYIKDSQRALEILCDFNFFGEDKLIFTKNRVIECNVECWCFNPQTMPCER